MRDTSEKTLAKSVEAEKSQIGADGDAAVAISDAKSWRERVLSFVKSRMFWGVALGAGGGFLWYLLVGCSTGACPLTANPWISSIYGSVLGLVLTMR
jgi:hypothetical protein